MIVDILLIGSLFATSISGLGNGQTMCGKVKTLTHCLHTFFLMTGTSENPWIMSTGHFKTDLDEYVTTIQGVSTFDAYLTKVETECVNNVKIKYYGVDGHHFYQKTFVSGNSEQWPAAEIGKQKDVSSITLTFKKESGCNEMEIRNLGVTACEATEECGELNNYGLMIGEQASKYVPASAHCIGLKRQLASIKTTEKQAAIDALIQSIGPPCAGYWIALIKQGNNYEWCDESPILSSMWGPGQPGQPAVAKCYYKPGWGIGCDGGDNDYCYLCDDTRC